MRSSITNLITWTIGLTRAGAERWTHMVLIVWAALILSGCRATQLLPAGLVPTAAAANSDEPSFDRLLEIEERQRVNGKQANRATSSRGDTASRRRPGYTPAESLRPGETSETQRLSAADLVQDEPAEVISVDDPDMERTKQALTRYVADRRASKDNAAMLRSDDVLEEAGPIEFNLSDDSEPQPLPERIADNRQPDRASRRYIEDSQDDVPSRTPSERRALPRQMLDARTADSPMAEGPNASGGAEERVPPRIATVQRDVTTSEYIHEDSSHVRRATHESGNHRSGDFDQQPARGMVPISNVAGQSGQSQERLGLDEHFRAIRELLSVGDATLNPRENAQRMAAARLVSLASGELESAMEPIPGLDEREQEYFRHQVQALFNFFDADGNPEQSRRCSLVMLDERKALEQLAAISSLEVKNVAFCTDVMGFGLVTTFPASNFKSNQEVLLYCELDNFVSEKISSGYETKLGGSYEILDASGKKVFNDKLPEDSHICRSRRRDYFIAYRLYMPAQIEAGKYTLKLTVHDIKGNKYGQAEAPFQIVL